MQFLNNTDLASITNTTVDAYLRANDTNVKSLPLCETFTKDGALWIDFNPKLDRKYSAPIPDDVIVSRNEEDLSLGRYGIFFHAASPAGNLLKQLIEAKLNLMGESNP